MPKKKAVRKTTKKSAPKKKAAKKAPRKTGPSARVVKNRVSRKARPLWLLERDGLTNTSMNNFMECREQFALRYIDGWTSKALSVPLTFGSLWHLAHEFSSAPDPWVGVQAYRDNAAENLTFESMQELDRQIAQVKTLFPLYRSHYRASDKKFKFIAHESSFSVTKKVLGVDVRIRGKRDGDYRYKNARQPGTVLGLHESKTKSRINTFNIRSALRADQQTLLYLWAMREEYGECPQHLTYDVVKRPGLHHRKGEAYPDYLKRVKLDVLKNPSEYFRRWEITVRNKDLDDFETEILIPILEEIVRWNLEVSKTPFAPERNRCKHHYRSLRALSTAYGKSDLYDLLVMGRKHLYYRRSSAHPELEE